MQRRINKDLNEWVLYPSVSPNILQGMLDVNSLWLSLTVLSVSFTEDNRLIPFRGSLLNVVVFCLSCLHSGAEIQSEVKSHTSLPLLRLYRNEEVVKDDPRVTEGHFVVRWMLAFLFWPTWWPGNTRSKTLSGQQRHNETLYIKGILSQMFQVIDKIKFDRPGKWKRVWWMMYRGWDGSVSWKILQK